MFTCFRVKSLFSLKKSNCSSKKVEKILDQSKKIREKNQRKIKVEEKRREFISSKKKKQEKNKSYLFYLLHEKRKEQRLLTNQLKIKENKQPTYHALHALLTPPNTYLTHLCWCVTHTNLRV